LHISCKNNLHKLSEYYYLWFKVILKQLKVTITNFGIWPNRI
jgi:hypothetical protein